jgi:hypothetical protein
MVDFRLWVLNFGFRVLGFWVLGFGLWILDFGLLRVSRPFFRVEMFRRVSETGRPVVFKSSHPVGHKHFLDSETGRSVVFKGRTKSFSDYSIFHPKEQAVNRIRTVVWV